MSFLVHDFQLQDLQTRRSIEAAGGKFVVVTNGGFDRVTLLNPDADFASLAQPVSLSRGKGRFAVADSVLSVDIYGIAPGGQAFQFYDVQAQELSEYLIDLQRAMHVLEIPFDAGDFTAATELSTGFEEPANAIMLPYPAVYRGAADGETLEVGTDSGDSGDADGFIDAVSLNGTGLVKATIANGGNTLGALFEVQDSANAGDLTHEGHVGAGKVITLTGSAGWDTATGKILLPYMLTRLS